MYFFFVLLLLVALFFFFFYLLFLFFLSTPHPPFFFFPLFYFFLYLFFFAELAAGERWQHRPSRSSWVKTEGERNVGRSHGRSNIHQVIVVRAGFFVLQPAAPPPGPASAEVWTLFQHLLPPL
jgi:hypothetical protein